MSRVEGFSVGWLWSSGTAGCMRCKLDFNAKMAVEVAEISLNWFGARGLGVLRA